MGRGASDSAGAQVFTRKSVDTLSVSPVEGTDDCFYVKFAPADGKSVQSGFISAADKARLEKADDAVAAFQERKATGPYDYQAPVIQVYQLLKPEHEDLLESVSYEEFVRDGGGYDFFVEPEEAIAQGYVDPDKLVRFDSYDNHFWRPGAKIPVSRPQLIELHDKYYDAEQARQLLEQNEDVLKVEVKPIPEYNRFLGDEELLVTVKLPQEKYDVLWQRTAKERDSHLTASQLGTMINIGAQMAKDQEVKGPYGFWLQSSGFTDILGIAAARYSTEAVRQREEELESLHEYDTDW